MLNKIELNSLAIIRLALAFFFFVAIFSLPYSYYQLLRLFGTIALVYLSYAYYKQEVKIFAFAFGIIALILNPVIKIYFTKDTWQILDFLFGAFCLISVLFEKKIISYSKKI